MKKLTPRQKRNGFISKMPINDCLWGLFPEQHTLENVDILFPQNWFADILSLFLYLSVVLQEEDRLAVQSTNKVPIHHGHKGTVDQFDTFWPQKLHHLGICGQLKLFFGLFFKDLFF